MKKLMLVGLVLLASVIVLAGCQMEAEPERPPKLESIIATSDTPIIYKKGDNVDSVLVLAYYDNGKSQQVLGEIISESNFTETAGVTEITVKYSEGGVEKSLTLKVGVIGEATYKFTETPQKLSNYSSSSAPTTGSWTYVKFGDWPQTRKSDDVMVNTEIDLTRGGLDFSVGTDGNYYVKRDSDYYKVEPIEWRVLTENYNSTGNALLLAEKILASYISYYPVKNSTRTHEGKTIYPNNYEHSQIRAYLNGLGYLYKADDSSNQIEKTEYKNNGFLQSAFTATDAIQTTKVDNSADSALYLYDSEANSEERKLLAQDYASNTTNDKIFLLSRKEMSNSDYGFGDIQTSISARIRVKTDYTANVYNGRWLQRSPSPVRPHYIYYNDEDGESAWNLDCNIEYFGIVPALCVSASAIK